MSGELDQLGVAWQVGAALEAGGAAWRVGGSVATPAYGERRATFDVDLVSDLRLSGVDPFVQTLGDTFYVDAGVVRGATRRGACFNVIPFATTEKIDVFGVAEPSALASLGRRRLLSLADGRMMPIATPEDMVVEKLRWYRLCGEVSDRKLRDVAGVLKVVGPTLDVATMRSEAHRVGVADLLSRALADADLDADDG